MNKNLLLAIAALTLLPKAAVADNTSTTVSQVSTAIVLNDDVDYHVSSTEPFTATGSIDIANTDHAVLIFDNLKPSVAVGQLGFVTINGAAAKNGVNCQVRIYDNGAMILPYLNDGVLTVYSEKGLKGESCSDFGLGNTGGYMNTLTTEQLNNKIKSFRLKRGYMVTFSLKSGGKGYSRCFVAAYNDLEIDLPALMQNRISSYRLFKWNDVSKKGLANNTGSEYNSALNTQWCYSFGAGEDTGMDRECVPHKIYGGWPSTAGIGQLTYSPHMKTSNEPANKDDDTPETVETVLGYWEDLMATGMRLCSPSQHDGGLSWTRAFMDSIDARGWRCDIVDIHCYWPEWNLLNMVNGYYTSYGRPIWISEWLWGASWSGGSGIFKSSDPENDNVKVLGGVLANWDESKYIERYAYWNSESLGHLYDGGGITASGELYRDFKASLGYNPDIQFVPRGPRMYKPTNMSLSFRPTTMVTTLTWNDSNGELLDSMFLERKRNDGEWERIATFEVGEKISSFSCKDTLSAGGKYVYRVHTITYSGSDLYSDEMENLLNGASSLGDGDVQYGTTTTSSTDRSYTYMDAPFADNEPAVVFGSVSNYQYEAALTEHLFKTFKTDNDYKFYSSNIAAWTDYEYADFYRINTATGLIGSEYTSYIIAKNGTGNVGSLAYESTIIAETSAGTVTEVTFTKPFNSVPVVLATPMYTSTAYKPMIARVYDVTTTGCKVKLMCQKSVMDSGSSNWASIGLFAIEQGKTTDGKGKQIIAKTLDYTFKNTSVIKIEEYDETLHNPTLLAQMQTLNRDVAAVLRTRPNATDSTALRLRYQVDTSDSDNSKVSSSNPVTETIGYIVISDGSNYTGIASVAGDKRCAGSDAIYDMQGRKVSLSEDELPKGLFIKNGKKIVIK